MWGLPLNRASLQGSLWFLTCFPIVCGARPGDVPALSVRGAWETELGLGEESALPLDEAKREEQRLLLAAATRPVLIAELRQVLGENPAPGCLKLAIERLAEIGDPALLPVAAELFGHFDEGHLQSVNSRRWMLEQTIELAATEGALQHVVAARSLAPAALQATFELAEVAAGSNRPLLNWPSADLTERQLEERIEGLTTLPFDADQAPLRTQCLERMLFSASDRVCASAGAGLGLAGATQAVSDLIPLTGTNAGAKTRRAAQSALQALTGVRWAQDERTWMEWFEVESAWARSELPGLAYHLVYGDPAEHADALRQVLQHPASTHRIAPYLAESVLWQAQEQALASLAGLAALPHQAARCELYELAQTGPREYRHVARAYLEPRR